MNNRLWMSSPLWLFLLPLIFLPDILFAQVGTATSSTVSPSLAELVEQGKHTYELFETGAILAGISGVINVLVNISKLGPIAEYIKRKKLKWIRLIAALILGFLAGLATAFAQGMEWPMASVTALVGFFSGGGAVVIHELVATLKGERK